MDTPSFEPPSYSLSHICQNKNVPFVKPIDKMSRYAPAIAQTMNDTLLIVGASGGLGAELLEAALADENVDKIHATSTRPVSSTHERVRWHQLDYREPATVSRLGEALAESAARLDGLIVATGILAAEDLQPEKNIAQLARHAAEESYDINAVGPLLVFQSCAKLLRAAPTPKALFLSAQVGSVEDNQLGGWYSYRMAKAALNMGIKCAAIEAGRWRNPATVVAVHPGTTRTALSRPFIQRRKAPVRSAADSAGRIYTLLAGLTATETGHFFTADGAMLPW